MSRVGEKLVDCDAKMRRARRAKAVAFLEDAEQLGEERLDAFVALCVLSGIASADVICCARLGVHAAGGDHSQAVRLLARTDSGAAKALQQLLSVKAKAEYSSLSPSKSEVARAHRAAARLLSAAISVGS